MRARETVLDNLWLAALICGLWVLSVVLREWNHEQLDLTALYYASRFYALEQFDLVYDASSPILLWNDAPDAWEDMAASLGQRSDRLTAYVYPPLWTWLLSSVTINLSPLAFFNAANAIFTTGFALGLFFFARALGAGVPVVLWVVVSLGLMEFTMIGQTAVQLGQPQTLVTGILLAAFAAYRGSLVWLAGGLVGLAAAIKLSPLIFAVIFLVDRSWRALVAFAFVGGGLGLLSIAVAGWPLHEVFLGRLATMDEMIMLSRINLSLQAVLAYLLGGPVGYEGYVWVEIPRSIGWVSSALTLLSVAAVWALRSRSRDDRSLLAALLVLGFAMPLSAPLGWVHYLLLVIGVLPGIIGFFSARNAALLLIVFAAGFSLPVTQWMLIQHLSVSMIYNALLATAFCIAAFLFGLQRRNTPKA